MPIQELRVQCDALRKGNLPLFAVSNLEWYSLFKDEIRNSIAIEGIFANRNDLLNVLEHKGHRSDLTQIYQLVLHRLQDVLKRLQNHPLVAAGPDAVLPLRQIAQHFNYSQDYLRNMINKGKIPAVKKGKLWYVKIRDIQAYIENLSS